MKIYKYLKPYTWQIIILVIAVYLQVMATLKLPDYMANIINDGILNQNQSIIFNNGLWMLVVSLGGTFFAISVSFLAARIATSFARDIRKKVFTKIENYSINEFNKFTTASLITRSTNDIQQVQNVTAMALRMMLLAPIMALGALQKAYSTAPGLSWLIAVAVGTIFFLIVIIFSTSIPKFKLMQKLIDKLNLVSRENLTGLRVIRAFNAEKREMKKFDIVNHDITKLSVFVNRLMMLLRPTMTLIMNLTLIGIVWFGSQLIKADNLQIGNMMAFMQYAVQVIMSFLMISIVFIIVPRASVSAKRIYEILDTETSIKNPKNHLSLKSNSRGKLEFKNVSFTYPGSETPTLVDINMIAEPGQTTAIIGSTGSGKSTLINLIPRLANADKGEILFDGLEIKKLNLHELRSKIGFVPQKNILFSGSIESNISYGKEILPNDELKHSAKIAQANEFIEKLENKYQSPIAQNGINISGGQKQRISIARALAIKPNIYIFDDSFSALDLKTDTKLRKALKKETKNKTVIIVSQRISTIMNAEKIIVMNEGKINGQGTHDELMKTNDIYKEIAFSQLSEKELSNVHSSVIKEEK